MRLQAEIERERETRRERQRDVREERRREKEADRERRRDEDRKRRDEDERRRADRELQMHTLMVQMLKEVAGGRAGSGKEDALMAAILAKVGQPDPLVLKLLDTHGKREELTDFFKVQADPTLAEWLTQPGVGDWLTLYLQKMRALIGESWSLEVEPTVNSTAVPTIGGDPII